LGSDYEKIGPDALELLIRVTTLMEDEVNELDLPSVDVQQIKVLVLMFYKNHYPIIATKC
jgi:hypothetical protein